MINSSDLLRVFADAQKVKLLGLLCDEPLPLHTLARAAGMSEAETMRQIGALKEAGLLQETFAEDGFRWRYQPSALFEALAALKQDAKPAGLSGAWTAEEAKVLGDFFVGNRLQTIPAQRKKREIVLRYLATMFELGRTYTEQEVSFRLLGFHEDYASLRREMVDTRLMARENGIYRRLPTNEQGAV
jgi:biotin operon repressor